jgi:hypothetical protein
MATAGKNARIRVGGTGVTFTAKPMVLVSDTTWKITDRDYIRWDRDVAPVFKDGEVSIPSINVAGIQYLTGQVVFVSGYAPTGTLTVDATYRPSSIIGWTKRGTIKETIELLDTTNFKTTAADISAGVKASRRRTTNIVDATGSFGGFTDTTSDFEATMKSKQSLTLEYQPNVNEAAITYVECLLDTNDKTFDVENPNEIDINWTAAYPVEYEPA